MLDSDTDSTKRGFPNLHADNWNQFAPSFEAYMCIKGLFGHFDGTEDPPEQLDPDDPTKAEKKEMKSYLQDRSSAAGYLCSALMNHSMLTLHSKDDDESLSTLVGRVSRAMQDIKALRPEKFTIDELDNELQSMALIRALPSDFDNFVSSILLLHSLSLDKLVAAFHTEETQRRSRDTASATSFKATAVKVQAAFVVPSDAVCSWCTNPGHTENQCFSKKKAQERAVQRTQERQTARGGKKGREVKVEKSSIAEETASQASIDPLSPASSNWNTDTGASSHMSHVVTGSMSGHRM
ncbi:uncharacterized protein ARMOST_22699 [Armillaria ostoyae]|uniref:CCHC-type domain-containing protein n=1 Tax=Armillaria ostoyae TaxID=47428 RepID=A0A284SDL8_ARMOS|nr:uncharacterized protein ARMOST_22699 [Armillaria ostoyae]